MCVPHLPGNISAFSTMILWVCLSLSYNDVSQHFLGAPLEGFRDLFPVGSRCSLGCWPEAPLSADSLLLLFPFLVVFPLKPLQTALQAPWAGGRVPIPGLGAAAMVWWLWSFRVIFLGGSGAVTWQCL